MKSIKTVGMLSAVLMAVCVIMAWLPARSAGSVILYVRNQPYTEPTIKEGSELYASLTGLLKALRFGWKVEGSTLTILASGPGPALTSQTYNYYYRGRQLTLTTRVESGTLWVSVSGLARAIGAGYQTNSQLNIAEVYFVPTAAPTSVATATETPAAVASAPSTPAATASGSASPAATASGSASPAASSSGSASPEVAAPTPTPAPTPHPDVQVTKSEVQPEFTNGRLVVTLEIQNPADVAAKDVNVHVDVLSGEGAQIFSQNVYVGTMTPHQVVSKTFDGNHPEGTSMPRSLYRAETQVTFTR